MEISRNVTPKQLRQPRRVAPRARGGAKAWHADRHDAALRQAQYGEGAQRHQQGKRRIEPARQPKCHRPHAGVSQPSGQPSGLDGEDLFAVGGALRGISWHEGRRRKWAAVAVGLNRRDLHSLRER